MRLRDYEKQVALLFGDCPGCDDCNTCRVRTLVGHVWESGRRSGSAASADRKAKALTWQEYDWTSEIREELITYTLKTNPEGSFTGRDHAFEYLKVEMEKAYVWQGSQDRLIKKMDWKLFLMGWLRRAGEPAQEGGQPCLFNSPSQAPSRQSQRDQRRQETYRHLSNPNTKSALR